MLDNDVLIEIVKIIQQSKQLVQNPEKANSSYAFQNNNSTLNDIQNNLLALEKSITVGIKNLNGHYSSKEKLLAKFQLAFKPINYDLQKLIQSKQALEREVGQYIHLNDIPDEQAYNLVLFFIHRKILADYLNWCDQLECSLLGIRNETTELNLDIRFEMMLFKLFNNILDLSRENARSGSKQALLTGLLLGLFSN